LVTDSDSLSSILTGGLWQLELKNGAEREDQAKMKKMKMGGDAKRKIVDDRKDDRTKVRSLIRIGPKETFSTRPPSRRLAFSCNMKRITFDFLCCYRLTS
jgi:hypothetical protein